jgi:hypothetical protein
VGCGFVAYMAKIYLNYSLVATSSGGAGTFSGLISFNINR